MSAADLEKQFPRGLPELRPFFRDFPGLDLSVHPKDLARPAVLSAVTPLKVDPKELSVKSIEIAGGDGQPLRVLVVKPASVSDGPYPVVLAPHAGGLVVGVPEQDLVLYTFFARNGIAVVSPDYRLSPEFQYPAAQKDVEATWDYITSDENAKVLGFDITRTALYGSSIGCSLAGGLAIRLKDKRATVRPRVVVLDTPLLDHRVKYPAQKPNHPLLPYQKAWTPENQRRSNHYVFGEGNEPSADAYPLHWADTHDLSGLPPHHISGAELDSLVDHSTEYAARLTAAGVPNELHIWRGTGHVFVTFIPDAEVSKAAREEFLRVIRLAVE